MPTYTQYRDPTDTTRGPSPIIWADCPTLEMLHDPGVGYHFFDDFISCPKTDAGLFEGAGESPGQGGYQFYGTTGVVMSADTAATEPGSVGGILAVTGNDADNDEGVISGGSPAFIISDTAAYSRKLWFEARVNKASIANDALAVFVGLGWDDDSQVSVAKTLCLTDNAGALGAFSFIGFHIDQADGDAWNFVYKAEGQAETELISGVAVPVADTYQKLGFVFDPDAPSDQRITVYVDGVANATYGTATNIAAATFPDAEAMAPVYCAKVGTGSAAVIGRMDWWRCAQLASAT